MNVLIPSIDIMNGRAVQLVGGEGQPMDGGDPLELVRKFGRVGDVAVIDLDAALGKGSNAELIEKMLPLASCRVGGGIRDAQTARRWLDAGATKVILGTRAVPEVLSELPRERVIAALDARHGKIVVEGWTKTTPAGIEDKMAELAPWVSGYLVTFVESEGRMQGIDLKRVREVAAAAGDRDLTVAGGVTTREEIAELANIGVQAQIGMALYTGRIDLAAGIWAQLKSDRPDKLVPTVVCDPRGRALGLAYSDEESLRVAIDEGKGAYHSRSRGLWIKGLSSGNTQVVESIALDCDRDALRFVVRQTGQGFCHLNTDNCWGHASGLAALETTLARRKREAPEGSYTKKLFDDPGLLAAKILEEAQELNDARSREDIIHEATDVIFFTLTRLIAEGLSLHDVEQALDQRAKKISRRGGERKDGC